MSETLLLASLALAVVPIVGILVWFLKRLQIETATKTPEVNILDLTVKEFILTLMVENRQLRELLNLREKDWEKMT